YKRTGPFWNTNALVQQINTQSPHTHFGENVAINEKLLVIGFIHPLNPLNELMGIEIYERQPSGYTFSKRLKFRRGISRLEPLSVKIQVRNDSIFLYEGVSYQDPGEPPSTLKIYTKKTNNEWSETSSFELPSGVSDQNIKFDVQNNHVFIGSPRTTVQGKTNAGAVVVFAKLPGSAWPSGKINHSSIIYSSEIREHAFFGYQVSNIENTLVIGAPENYDLFPSGESGAIYHTLYGPVREVPGAVYVFESSDYYWKNASQILKLQGSFFNQQKWDGAGLSVDSDYEHYFFGAPNETNDHGFWAGAVYTIPTPPLVKLLPPVCVYNEPVKLQGYPFGGVWNGAGVNGESFDPSEAGPGKHLLRYKTPNCAYEGKLEIEVIQDPDATIVGPLEVLLCPENPVTLTVKSTQGATYQWYVKPLDGTGFAQITFSIAPFLFADKAGVYYCTVTYGMCSANSSFITVKADVVSVTSGPQPVICTEGEVIQLITTTPGGQWSGTGVIDPAKGIFSAQNLASGIYPLTYSYTSPAGCQYLIRDSVRIGTIQLEVTPTGTNITACEENGVTLAVKNPQPEVIYRWLKKEGEDFFEASTDPVFEVKVSGSFKLNATSMYCEAESSIRQIEILKEDSLWTPNVFSPNNDGLNDEFVVITNNDDYTFQILNRYGQEVYESVDRRPWDGGNHPSGQYFWIVRYTTCSGTAKTKKGWVHKVN
ncbi:MAG TPA: gliding motility-associated C-terminal domain-containing protein, partial [Chryseolinea sp.]|nr:gliding motility-associated C-terminal domain-containing protein [Chryseolinea sp.]